MDGVISRQFLGIVAATTEIVVWFTGTCIVKPKT
jgi:hypothetical protein